jgi:hypothetical protein
VKFKDDRNWKSSDKQICNAIDNTSSQRSFSFIIAVRTLAKFPIRRHRPRYTSDHFMVYVIRVDLPALEDGYKDENDTNCKVKVYCAMQSPFEMLQSGIVDKPEIEQQQRKSNERHCDSEKYFRRHC